MRSLLGFPVRWLLRGGLAALLVALLLPVASSASVGASGVVPSPNEGPFDNILWGVDALSPTQGWAVGHTDTGTLPALRRPLIERWNGTRWSIVPSPTPPQGGELRDVDALSGTDAWAVGFTNTNGGNDTLTQRWNGTAWAIVPSPSLSAQNHLLGVRAFSRDDAWAVGANNSPGSLAFDTLVERWDGTRWRIVPSPSPDPFENHLHAVDGVSSSDLWAVGYTQNGPDALPQPLIEHYNGSAWTTVPAPHTRDGRLEDLVALASDDVWAVGWRFSLPLLWHVPYALHWNGTEWRNVPIPQASPQGGLLFGVTALSSSEVYAVGETNESDKPALVMRWNGRRWKVVTGSTVAHLWDAAAAPGVVWGVGSRQDFIHGNLGPSQTFVVRIDEGS